jgi:hypothetical protein
MAHQRLLSNVTSAQVPSVKSRVVDASIRSELLNCIKGTLCCRDDQRFEFTFFNVISIPLSYLHSFELHSKIFNGDVVVQASVLVQPFDTEDVSQYVESP